MRKTEIVPWSKKWEESYREEEKLLKEIFINDLVDIFHIGSTSVPAIGYAKPIIDILMIVKNIDKVDAYNNKMQTFGYEPRGENGISGRRYFPKGKDKRTHHVHIYQIGNKNIEIHLSFKNYLSNYPEEAIKYGKLKIELANKFKDHTHQYQKGKEAFVHELVEKSLRWRNEKNK